MNLEEGPLGAALWTIFCGASAWVKSYNQGFAEVLGLLFDRKKTGGEFIKIRRQLVTFVCQILRVFRVYLSAPSDINSVLVLL